MDFVAMAYDNAQGAEDSGDIISLHAVAMVFLLRAYLYCICNFHFQQVEAPVLYPEQHCV